MSDAMSGILGGAIQLTPGVISNQVVANILADQTSIANLQEQLSTGNQVNKPSDNPAQAANIMQLQAALDRSNTYSANASDGLGWLSTANATMNGVLSTLQQVRQVVLSISSTSLSNTPGGLAALADQVDSAQKALLNLSNTAYNGQAIFAGTGNTSTAFDATGTYVGGGSAPARSVAPGVSVSVGVTGDTVFGGGPTGLLSTVPGSLGVLAQLSQDIRTGTTASLAAAMGTDLSNLDAGITRAQNQAAQLGAQYQRMQAMQTQATNTQTALNVELSGVQAVNLPEALTNLQQRQNSYQTALWAASQLIQPNLVQFLS